MDQENLPQETPQETPEPAAQPPSPAPEPIPAPPPYTPPASDVLPASALATVSLVAGILGFTFMPLIGSVVALVTGYMARKETRAVPPRASGDGMATAGIVMGWIEVGLAVVGFCCFIAWMVFVLVLAARGGQSSY